MFKIPDLYSLYPKFERELFYLVKSLKFNFSAYKKEKQSLIIVGAQRSGTNLLMDILERNFLTDVYHERDSRAFDKFQMKSIDKIISLKTASKAKFFIIKGLCESQYTAKLLNDFFPAKAIWVVRDYNDVVNSMDISFKSTTNTMIAIKENRDCGDWITDCMSEETYALVCPLIYDDMSNKTASAIQWYIRNIIYFEKEFDKNPKIKLLIYNDLVTKPSEIMHEICEFSGLDYQSYMINIINKKSIKKNNSPDIDEPVREICAQLLQRFLEHVN